MLSIKGRCRGGTSLTSALRKHPLYFDDLFCNLVEAGEQAGVLETLLDKIATCKEKTESLEGEDQEGAVLSDRGHPGRDPDHRDHHDFRYPAVQGSVQQLRRRPAGFTCS